MLLRARKPSKLAELDTVNQLRRLYGIMDPVATLRRLVDDTFSDAGASMQRLREMIVRCDIDASVTQKAFAQELHVSYRHFHRIRAEAVAAIAAHLGLILGISPTAPPELPEVSALAEILAEQRPRSAEGIFSIFGARSALVQITRLQALIESGEELDDRALEAAPAVSQATLYALIAQSKELNGKPFEAQAYVQRLNRHLNENRGVMDDTTRAELTWRAFLNAKYRASAIAIESQSRALERFATEHARAVRRAVLARVTAYMHAGDLENAQASLERFEHIGYRRGDGDGMATALLLRAQMAHMAAEPDRAVAYARAASAAIERPHLRSECAATLLNAEIAAGRPLGTHLPLRGSKTYGNLQFRLAYARLQLHVGNLRDALIEAEATAARADELGYDGLAARAVATVGTAHARLGNAAAARAAYLRALARYAPTWSLLVAFDLFSAPGTRQEHLDALSASEDLADLTFERLRVIVPQIADDDAIQRRRTRVWLQSAFARTIAIGSAESLRDATVQLSAANATLAHALPRRSADIRHVLAMMLMPLLPHSQRSALTSSVGASVNEGIALLQPASERGDFVV